MREASLWKSESILVMGRRATHTDANRELRQNLCPADTHMMTFDQLALEQ